MPDALFFGSMLFPSVHELLLWWTFGAFGAVEWNGATFAIVNSPLSRGVRGGGERNGLPAGVIPRREYVR